MPRGHFYPGRMERDGEYAGPALIILGIALACLLVILILVI